MSISGTYGQMQKQIADELGDRSDLLTPLSDSGLTLSPIQNAIQSAIALWERERFYFNELLIETFLNQPSYPFQTSPGQEYYGASTTPSSYAAIPTIAKIDKIWTLINSNRYTMTPRVFQYMADTSVNPVVTGYPVDYAYANQQLRFYPIPDGTYPIGLLGTQRLSALADDDDANAWTEDAWDLIRTQAKLVLAQEVLYDANIAASMKVAIYGDPSNLKARGYLSALQGESTRRRGLGRIRPSHF